jgi:Flp pilus assembly protein TadD
LLAFGRFSGARAAVRRAVIAYALLWIALYPEVRFFMPILPALLALVAGEMMKLFGRGFAWRSGMRVTLEAGLVAGAVYGAGIQWMFFAPFTLVLGRETVASKLELGLPPAPFTWYMKEYVNSRVPRGDRILYACNFCTYYVERECIADFHFDRAHITKLIRESGTAEELAKSLKRRGIGWILSTGTLAAQYGHIPGFFGLTENQWREFKRFLATRASAEWQTEEYVLYRIGRPHAPRTLPALPVYEALAYAPADRALGDGRPAEALAAFENPPPLLADVGSTFVRRGDALLSMGDAARAERAFTRARALGSDNPRISTGLATARMRLGRPKEGLAHAEKGWRQNPLSAFAAATYAMNLSAVGRGDDARRLIRKAIRLRPDVPEYRELEKRLAPR